MLFINNISIKSSYTNYKGALFLLKVYYFVFEYLINLNKIIERIKRTNTIIKPKSQFYYNSIIIIGFIYNSKGKSPKVIKVNKILNQMKHKTIIEIKVFLKIYIYITIYKLKDIILLLNLFTNYNKKELSSFKGKSKLILWPYYKKLLYPLRYFISYIITRLKGKE